MTLENLVGSFLQNSLPGLGIERLKTQTYCQVPISSLSFPLVESGPLDKTIGKPFVEAARALVERLYEDLSERVQLVLPG